MAKSSPVRVLLDLLALRDLRTLARHHGLADAGSGRELRARLAGFFAEDLERLLCPDSPWLVLFWSDLVASRMGGAPTRTYAELRAEVRRACGVPNAGHSTVPASWLREKLTTARKQPELLRWLGEVLEEPETTVSAALRYDHGKARIAEWLPFAEAYVTLTRKSPAAPAWVHTVAPLVALCMGVASAGEAPPSRAAVRAVRRRIQTWFALSTEEVRPLRELLHRGPPKDLVTAVARCRARLPIEDPSFLMSFLMNFLVDVARSGGALPSPAQRNYINAVAEALSAVRSFWSAWQAVLDDREVEPPGRAEYERWVRAEEDEDEAPAPPNSAPSEQAPRSPKARAPFVDRLTEYLSVLGLSRRATVKELRARYKQLAFEHHPDRDPNATSSDRLGEMVRINVAYQRALELLERVR
jgi:hypothetical protein